MLSKRVYRSYPILLLLYRDLYLYLIKLKKKVKNVLGLCSSLRTKPGKLRPYHEKSSTTYCIQAHSVAEGKGKACCFAGVREILQN